MGSVMYCSILMCSGMTVIELYLHKDSGCAAAVMARSAKFETKTSQSALYVSLAALSESIRNICRKVGLNTLSLLMG